MDMYSGPRSLVAPKGPADDGKRFSSDGRSMVVGDSRKEGGLEGGSSGSRGVRGWRITGSALQSDGRSFGSGSFRKTI